MRTVTVFSAASWIASGLSAQLPDHSTFAAVLDTHWHDGLIDYAGLTASRSVLDSYLVEMGAVDPRALDRAPRGTRLAFWINAYNACALALVVDHYPIERRGGAGGVGNRIKGYPANSVQQIDGTWKRKFCEIAGQVRSLDDIEHGVIRPMGDPRIHFAVNCASRSCPMLAGDPYTGEDVDAQLDEAVRRFVGDSRHYAMERGRRRVTIHLNKVLDWYKDDFGGTDGVVAFLLPFLPATDQAYARENGPVRVRFEDYDWTLNDTAVFGRRR
jgi:hypothetical protein